MKLLKNYGKIVNKKKLALYLCEKCNNEVEACMYSVKQKEKNGLINCGKCNSKANGHKRSIKDKNIIHGVKIIKNIPFEKGKKRFLIIECPLCKIHEKKRMDTIKNNPLCKKCVNLKNAKNRITHGKTNTPLHKRWCDMIARCHWKSGDKAQKYYKNKNITVCNEWKNDFMKFHDWAINNGYSPELELDKDILSDAKNISPKIYSPETCMWITKKQNINYAKKHNITIEEYNEK